MAFNLFKEHNVEEHTDNIASYLLNGLHNISKYKENSDYRKLLKSFSKSFLKLEQQINAGARELFPDETIELISEWEAHVGIPDDIFDNNGSIEERRNNVLLKLASLGVQTEEDFIFIASLIGYDDIQISTGTDVGIFPLVFPAVFFSSAKEARFTMIVDLPTRFGVGFFPIPFPCRFVSNQNNALEGLFEILKPANVQLIFRYVL